MIQLVCALQLAVCVTVRVAQARRVGALAHGLPCEPHFHGHAQSASVALNPKHVRPAVPHSPLGHHTAAFGGAHLNSVAVPRYKVNDPVNGVACCVKQEHVVAMARPHCAQQ